jgi:hypothetical protein
MATCSTQELLDAASCFACLSSEEREIAKLQLLCELQVRDEILFVHSSEGGSYGPVIPIPITAYIGNVPGYYDLTPDLEALGYSSGMRSRVTSHLLLGKSVKVGFRGVFSDHLSEAMQAGFNWPFCIIRFCGSTDDAMGYYDASSKLPPPYNGDVYFDSYFECTYSMRLNPGYEVRDVSSESVVVNGSEVSPGYMSSRRRLYGTQSVPPSPDPDGKFYLSIGGAFEPESDYIELALERLSVTLLA